MKKYRSDIPPVPYRMKDLPVQNGYPIPWFVAMTAEGVYDFRAADAQKLPIALKQKKCWVCGQPLAKLPPTFVIGPMCVINRTTAEPPCHPSCAEWSAIACPALAHRQPTRRDSNLPEDMEDPAGIALYDLPKAVCLWGSKSWSTFQVPNGTLIDIGEPKAIKWMVEGKVANRAQVIAAIEAGLPALMKLAELEGADSVKELENKRAIAWKLLPRK